MIRTCFIGFALLLLFEATNGVSLIKDNTVITCKEQPYNKKLYHAGKPIKTGKVLDCKKKDLQSLVFDCDEDDDEDCKLNHVKLLDVSSNRVKNIDEKSFPSGIKLQGLYLHNNELTNFFNGKPNVARIVLKHLTALSLGRNRFSCDCAISWLWKDYKGIYQILPRNLLGFHILKKPAGYGSSYLSEYPPVTCYDTVEKTTKSFNEVDLSRCIDKFSGAVFDKWSSWSKCGVLCGYEEQKRTRKCNRGQPTLCPGHHVEYQECVKAKCLEVEKAITWSSWSECSVKCGQGTRTRNVTCNGDEDLCSQIADKTQECTGRMGECMEGFWSAWTTFERNCVQLCKTEGYQIRRKLCLAKVTVGLGNIFSNGSLIKSDESYLVKVGKRKCWELGNSFAAEEYRQCHFRHGQRTRVKCTKEWAKWGTWSECSASCDRGLRERERACDGDDRTSPRGLCIGPKTEVELCQKISCVEHHWRLNGGWGFWSPWSQCPEQCDETNESARVRKCENEGKGLCIGKAVQKKPCKLSECYGQWHKWSDWIQCSATCGWGFSLRRRGCNVTEKFAACYGFDTDYKPCIETACDTQNYAGRDQGQTLELSFKKNGNIIIPALASVVLIILMITVYCCVRSKRNRAAEKAAEAQAALNRQLFNDGGGGDYEYYNEGELNLMKSKPPVLGEEPNQPIVKLGSEAVSSAALESTPKKVSTRPQTEQVKTATIGSNAMVENFQTMQSAYEKPVLQNKSTAKTATDSTGMLGRGNSRISTAKLVNSQIMAEVVTPALVDSRTGSEKVSPAEIMTKGDVKNADYAFQKNNIADPNAHASQVVLQGMQQDKKKGQN